MTSELRIAENLLDRALELIYTDYPRVEILEIKTMDDKEVAIKVALGGLQND